MTPGPHVVVDHHERVERFRGAEVAVVPAQVGSTVRSGPALVELHQAREVRGGEPEHAAGTEHAQALAQHPPAVVPGDVLGGVLADDEVQRPVLEGERLGTSR